MRRRPPADSWVLDAGSGPEDFADKEGIKKGACEDEAIGTLPEWRKMESDLLKVRRIYLSRYFGWELVWVEAEYAF